MKCYAKSSENLIVQLANLPPKPPFLSKSFHLFSCTGKTHYLCISSAKNKEQNKTFLPFNFQNIGRQLVQYAASDEKRKRAVEDSIVNFYSIGPVTPQLLVEEFFFTPDQPVEQRMEAGGMVVVDGVAEFVEDDEVAQMFGQRHQVQAQRQVVAPVAGAPFGAGGPDRYRTVLQTGSHCEFRYAGR